MVVDSYKIVVRFENDEKGEHVILFEAKLYDLKSFKTKLYQKNRSCLV